MYIQGNLPGNESSSSSNTYFQLLLRPIRLEWEFCKLAARLISFADCRVRRHILRYSPFVDFNGQNYIQYIQLLIIVYNVLQIVHIYVICVDVMSLMHSPIPWFRVNWIPNLVPVFVALRKACGAQSRRARFYWRTVSQDRSNDRNEWIQIIDAPGGSLLTLTNHTVYI